MKIIQLQADNFKRLRTVEIAPDGNMVTVGGKNGQGKSSVLDAIYVALKGLSAAPPQPIRAGEDKCTIRLDIGEMVITRTFTRKGDQEYTHTLKVETADGLRYGKPQDVLNGLLGEIGFDPFEFVKMKPADQADTLLEMVPLRIDLEEFQARDASDTAKRTDVNRDIKGLTANIAAIPKVDVPETIPDKAALMDRLTNAAGTNVAINRERMDREDTLRFAIARRDHADELRGVAERQLKAAQDAVIAAQAEAERIELAAKADEADADRLDAELAALPPLDEPVDTEALRQEIAEAERVELIVGQQRTRGKMTAQLDEWTAQSQALTDALAERLAERNAALAEARMPIGGLSFHVPETGKPRVYLEGVPFEQASTAEQIRASTAIAMAANPNLRVLRIKDGSLLDEDSIAILNEMAAAEDFQLFVEVVSRGESVGIIMEDGSVVGGTLAPATEVAPEEQKADPKPKAKPKAVPQSETLL